MEKKVVYIDMDNVLVNFRSALGKVAPETLAKYEDDGTGKNCYDEIPGLFALMEPNEGAIEAVHRLYEAGYDLYILSTAPWNNPSAWCDKLEWIKRYFGNGKDSIFYKRIIISHHKDLNRGDYLIDDRPRNGTRDFRGEWIPFNPDADPREEWERIVAYLCG